VQREHLWTILSLDERWERLQKRRTHTGNKIEHMGMQVRIAGRQSKRAHR
jgi:hypothetical protein